MYLNFKIYLGLLRWTGMWYYICWIQYDRELLMKPNYLHTWQVTKTTSFQDWQDNCSERGIRLQRMKMHIIIPVGILITLSSFWAHEHYPPGLEIKFYFSFWKSRANHLINTASNSELTQHGVQSFWTYLFLSTFWPIHWQS